MEHLVKSKETEEEIELSGFESELFSVVSYFWQRYISGEEINLADFAKEFAPQLMREAIKEIWGNGNKTSCDKNKYTALEEFIKAVVECEATTENKPYTMSDGLLHKVAIQIKEIAAREIEADKHR